MSFENENYPAKVIGLLFERGTSIRRVIDDFCRKLDVKPETALESNDTYFVELMIEHGLGVSPLPAWVLREEVENGKPAPIHAFLEYTIEPEGNLQTPAEAV